MEEMISNLYKIKQGEEESKYNKEKMMKYDSKVEGSGKIKTIKQRAVKR